jgi:hypothetical protein
MQPRLDRQLSSGRKAGEFRADHWLYRVEHWPDIAHTDHEPAI